MPIDLRSLLKALDIAKRERREARKSLSLFFDLVRDGERERNEKKKIRCLLSASPTLLPFITIDSSLSLFFPHVLVFLPPPPSPRGEEEEIKRARERERERTSSAELVLERESSRDCEREGERLFAFFFLFHRSVFFFFFFFFAVFVFAGEKENHGGSRAHRAQGGAVGTCASARERRCSRRRNEQRAS